MNEPAANAVTQPAVQVCANCRTPGTDNYCGHCGQRLDTHIHSVWHFAGEATEVLTHADSRVWNTLRPLLLQPGFLSREFFAGRRARYLQPFRLYVVLSVVFLLLAGWLGEKAQTVHVVASDADKIDCQSVKTDLPGAAWLRPRMISACQKLKTEGGGELGQSIVHNLGRAMFVFLPLMALFMKLLYWRPRRYYLEHLLLLLHNHAFVFLWMSAYLLAVHWMKSSGWQTLLSFLVFGYFIRYLYRSMQVFYQQNWFLTFAKFAMLLFVYIVCGGFMLMATTLISAVTL
jgi:hypothetical protein